MLGLDLVGGAKICIGEMYGDWYRDPWGWIEYQWVSTQSAKIAEADLIRTSNKGTYIRHPAHFDLTEIPKNRLAVRPAVIIDPLTRLLFSASVAANLKTLHKDLPDWVFGWRHRNGVGLAANGPEWEAYGKSFQDTDDSSWGLSADITSFFASIDVERLSDRLRSLLGKTAAVGIIADVIGQHDKLTSRSGIPQRSFASAALAHLYMTPIDDLLSSFADRQGTTVSRWMDDLNATGPDDKLYTLHLDLESRARQLGLELNGSKSRLVPIEKLRLAIQADAPTDTPLIKAGEGEDPLASSGARRKARLAANRAQVLNLEALILERKGSSPSWLIKAVLSAQRDLGDFRRMKEWRELSSGLPHVADALGRYLRDAGLADEESPESMEDQEWFSDLTQTGWLSLSWVASQFALSIPMGHFSPPYRTVLEHWLETSRDPQQVAIAGQRLAASDPSKCRDIIRARVDNCSSPMLLRACALSLLAAHDDRLVVKAILQRDDRNILLLRALDDSGYSPPTVTEDFSGLM